MARVALQPPDSVSSCNSGEISGFSFSGAGFGSFSTLRYHRKGRPVERRLSGQHLVQHDRPASRCRCAGRPADPSPVRRMRCIPRARVGERWRRSARACLLSWQCRKVDELKASRLFDHDVLRLQVAGAPTRAVHVVLEASQMPSGNLDRPSIGQPALLLLALTGSESSAATAPLTHSMTMYRRLRSSPS